MKVSVLFELRKQELRISAVETSRTSALLRSTKKRSCRNKKSWKLQSFWMQEPTCGAKEQRQKKQSPFASGRGYWRILHTERISREFVEFWYRLFCEHFVLAGAHLVFQISWNRYYCSQSTFVFLQFCNLTTKLRDPLWWNALTLPLNCDSCIPRTTDGIKWTALVEPGFSLLYFHWVWEKSEAKAI